jgi:aminoglycoside 2'-N-acetyltransferase I
MIEINVYPQDDIPLDLKRSVLGLLTSAWPDPRPLEVRLAKPLHDPRSEPTVVVLTDGGETRAYLTIPTSTISHAGTEFRASGLSAVVSHPASRGAGYGAHIVVAARELIEASGVDIGIFTCDPPLVAFYARCGWEPMPSTVVVGGTRERPFRADSLDKRTLMAFFTPHAQEHRAAFDEIDVYLDLREGDLW